MYVENGLWRDRCRGEQQLISALVEKEYRQYDAHYKKKKKKYIYGRVMHNANQT